MFNQNCEPLSLFKARMGPLPLAYQALIKLTHYLQRYRIQLALYIHGFQSLRFNQSRIENIQGEKVQWVPKTKTWISPQWQVFIWHLNCIRYFKKELIWSLWEDVHGISLVVQWLRIHLAMQGTLVWSLVGEVRFHMPRSD